MLRFIVLGQIPGTEFQINFLQLVVLGLFGMLIFEMFLNRRRQELLTAESALVVATPSRKKRRSPAKKAATKRKTTKKKPASKKTSQTQLDKISI